MTRDSTDLAAIPATFFDPALLNQQPRPLREPSFELLMPILAREGQVQLVLYIDESGKIERVEIGSATMPPAAAERVAQIFAAIPFSPGRIDGTAVKTRVRITVGAENRRKEEN